MLSTMMDAVDEASLSQLRTYFNDGRAAARAFFYRFIGFLHMNTSPKVLIRLVHPTADMSDPLEAEGSAFFAIETYHVGSANGAVSPLQPTGVTASANPGPSGGSFCTVRSAITGAGLLQWNTSVKRDIGTDSSFISQAGIFYPHVSGEHLIKREDCLIRLARGLTQQLLKGSAHPPPQVTFAIAKSFRDIFSEQAVPWTAADGGSKSQVDVVGPCNWWLLGPRLSMRSTLDTNIQTLTTEEQLAITSGNGQMAGPAGGGVPDAEEAVYLDEGVMDDEEDLALDGGGDMQLDA